MPAATAEIDLAGAVEAPLPGFVPPMLATLGSTPFSDPDWLFEIKWDGYRLQAIVDDGKVRTYTRRGLDGVHVLSGPPDLAGELDHGRPGDHRRRGRRPRRERRPRLRIAPGGDQQSPCRDQVRVGGLGDQGHARLPGLRPALPRRTCLAQCPARGSQATSQVGAPHERAASDSPRTSRPTGWPSTRRPRAASWKGSSPSSVARDTSRVADRRPG